MKLIKGFILVVWWGFFAWLATHKSGHPEILGRYSSTFLWVLIAALIFGVLLTWVLLWKRPGSGKTLMLQLKSWSLAIVFGLVFGLLATELVVRSFDLLGASFYHEITRQILDLEADEHSVYRLKSEYTETYQNVEVRTNSLGFRDTAITERKPDEFRILVLGDSVAFGWGVEQEKVFPRLLENQLQQVRRPNTRVINSAVIGYNTQQELAVLKSKGLALNPDLILLIYVDNDVHPAAIDVGMMREKWNSPDDGNTFLLKYSWLYRIYYHVVPYLIGGKSNQLSPEGFDSSMVATREIARISRTAGLPFATAFFRLSSSEVTDRLDGALQELSKDEGFVYRDLLPLFEDRNIRQLTNSIIDIHPNAQGHQLIADELMLVVEEAMRPEEGSASLRGNYQVDTLND